MVAPLILVEDQHTKYRVADYICKLAIIDFAFHSHVKDLGQIVTPCHSAVNRQVQKHGYYSCGAVVLFV